MDYYNVAVSRYFKNLGIPATILKKQNFRNAEFVLKGIANETPVDPNGNPPEERWENFDNFSREPPTES
ncbi:hypothetical protein K0M31_018309 [Melipona bicolor]|uniref:Uncharacterized protein n=1 Tax=Melipona bicolor TaxID=60889 RepID=A0AA40G3U8_9HYME|nr:hypothetical protein K0M31_018309 [Melipona bicolor]